ncbi:unnamed protein product [Owenia fusiformis]|uniref:Uncharacterized protein n=1 Tax=Owenia fusiformis TaxID=6347 RepID=A0A8J1UGC6_OWEFU|nr:unnamed protein product [Owenia fusiformis]
MLRLLSQLCLMFLYCEAINNHAKVGFETLMTEFTNASVTKVSGEFPDWINGRFIRQIGGSFGDLDSPNPMERIEHWFDGVGGAGMYHINGGDIKFTNRFYDSRGYNIWKSYNYDWSKSQVSWATPFSPFNLTKLKENQNMFRDKLDSNPQVSFWKLGDNIEAVTETVQGMLLDKYTMESKGGYDFKESPPLGQPTGSILINNPAHDRIDKETGELWSVAGAIVPLTPRGLGGPADSKLLLYQVINDTRIVKGEINLGNFSLGECNPVAKTPYPDTSKLMPYLHSFTITKNYIIIPGTSMLMDYCEFFMYRPETTPTFKKIWTFMKAVKSKVYVVDKSNMKVVASMEIDPMFVTHQLNAYEKDGKIMADMLIYDDERVYYDLKVRDLYNGTNFVTDIARLVIDTSNWSITKQHLTKDYPVNAEFSHVNNAFHGREYKYAYIVMDVLHENSTILKLNVDTKEELRYDPGFGLMPWEPIFIPKPGATVEDDGFLLLNGISIPDNKTFFALIDAKTMKETARVLAPALLPAGIHNRFYAEPSIMPRMSTTVPTTVKPGNGVTRITQSFVLATLIAVIAIWL